MAKRDSVPGLGEKLKSVREKAGLTQTAAEELSGVAQTNIARYENGVKTPTLAVIYKLAAAYGVAVADLLPISSNMSSAEKTPPPASKDKK